MSSSRKIGRLAAVAAALLAIGAAGCGDEEQRRLLTEKRSDTLLDLLEDAQKQFDEGKCDKLEETLDELENEVSQVSGSVDSDVREALQAETEQLVEMRDECEPAEEPEPVETEPVEPVPTETFVPPETVTETTAPETTETTEPETEPEKEPPPEEPPGQGSGNSGPGGGGGAVVTPPRGSGGDSGED